jgi:hypothetical protein
MKKVLFLISVLVSLVLICSSLSCGSSQHTPFPTFQTTTTTTSTTPAFQSITFTSNEYKPNEYFITEIPPFYIPSEDWVIDWSYTPITGGDEEFSLFVYPNFGPDTNTEIASVFFPNNNSGSLTCKSGPGEHQIIIITRCNWSLTIHLKN